VWLIYETFLVQNRIKQQYLYMLITLRYSPLNNLQTFERIFLGLKLSRFKSGFSHRFTKTVKFSKWWLQLYQPNRTLGSVDSLLAATLYQWNPDRNHKLISYHLRDIYILHMQVYWNVATYKWKVHNGKIEIISFVVTFRS
jgi:hypothetical protein